jgi:hypothetical protein
MIAVTFGVLASVARGDQARPTPDAVGPIPGTASLLIQSCGESGFGYGWALTRSNPGALDGGVACPPVRGMFPESPLDFSRAGLWLSERLGADGGDPEAHANDHAELTFSPAAGTTVTRMRYWRSIHSYVDDSWKPYIGVGDGTIIDSCAWTVTSECGVGASDWYANDTNPTFDRTSYADVGGLNANAIIVGLRCLGAGPQSVCFTGPLRPFAEAAIFSAFLTISDPTPPIPGAPTGAGWTTSEWAQGTLPLAMSSADNTGIYATRVYADGSLIATLQRACTYDRPRPCTDEPTGAVGLPTETLTDGTHNIQLASVNAAGTETRVSRPTPLRVDNQAPAAPVGLAASTPISAADQFDITWQLPPDAGTPLVAATYQLCRGAVCDPARSTTSPTTITGLSLPTTGSYTLRVWLADELGHTDAAQAASIHLAYSALGTSGLTPPLPSPSPTAPTTTAAKTAASLKLTTLRRTGRRVIVAGSLAASARGKLIVRYRVRQGQRTRTVSKAAVIRSGRFRLTLTLGRTIARSRRATVTVLYAGDDHVASETRTSVLRVAG